MRSAIANGGGDAAISDAVSRVMISPDVLLRVKRASRGEIQGIGKKIDGIYQDLHANEAAPPLDKTAEERSSIQGFEEAGERWPALTSPEVADRMKGLEPEVVDFLAGKVAATVIESADAALRATAGKDAEVPTQQDIAAWVPDGCAKEILGQVAERLGEIWGKPVTVTGWAYGGLTAWRDGVEYHAPAATVLKEATAAESTGAGRAGAPDSLRAQPAPCPHLTEPTGASFDPEGAPRGAIRTLLACPPYAAKLRTRTRNARLWPS